MEMTPTPLTKDVVLIGGGHSHALMLRAWGMKPVRGARLTVINPAPSAPYTGMLPSHVAGHYTREELEIDLVRLTRHAGARLIVGIVDHIDPVAQKVMIRGRPDLSYDIASIDIGISSNLPETPGFLEHAVAAKPLGPFAARWERFLETEAGASIAVIGGGIGGVELALAMRYRTGACEQSSDVTIIEARQALTGVAPGAREILLSELKTAGITLIENASVESISADGITLADGAFHAAKLVVGTAGARPFDWLRDTGLHLTDGFVTVDAQLRSVSHPTLYATGDCAHFSHAPRPKAGVFAVRAAPVLTHNIRADLTGSARRRFQPQSSYLKLISLGDKRALTDKWNLSVKGAWVWSWKDRIDRAFMDRLATLPEMQPKAPGLVVSGKKPDQELCGGCGAKVGAGTLDRMLARATPTNRPDIEAGPGDDAAVLKIGDTRQVISTDHLRAFWNDPFVMARITAVHALGDVWAMGAEPQAMLAQIILPRMDERLQATWLNEIMTAAGAVATDAGAAIVGGHTTLGSELTIGFTVTGIAAECPISLTGGKPGDALVLTRPIGSGTLLAAEMARKAKGRDVQKVLSIMGTPQGDAAALLRPVANAMTDITGFGLAGHLARMADGANLSAEIELEAVPLYPGALDLAARGVRSSLYEANRESVSHDLSDSRHAALMFDPQTAGGFLAALPPGKAEAVVQDLIGIGHDAARIGSLIPREAVTVKGR